MRYDQIKHKYPDIDRIMDKTAGLIYAGANIELVVAQYELWIKRNILATDTAAVTKKLEQWIAVVNDNNHLTEVQGDKSNT